MATNESGLKEYLVERIATRSSYDGLLRFPSYLEIETVNACNARCPMCTITHWKRAGRPMTDELFGKIAREAIEHAGDLKRVNLYRDGEPLLDKKLGPRVSMLKDGGVKNVCVSTNVSLLDEARSKELLGAGLDTVIMSIDSLDKKTFEAIRSRLVFEEVMANALRFIGLRDQLRPRTRIWMRMIRQRSNRDEWPAYQEFWSKRLGPSDRVYYHNIFNWGSQLTGFTPVARSYEPNLPCVALWSLMVIFTNGDVPLCNVDFNAKFQVGSVLKDGIAGLWRSERMNDIRQAHLKGSKSRIRICKGCNVWDEPSDERAVSPRYAEPVDIGGDGPASPRRRKAP